MEQKLDSKKNGQEAFKIFLVEDDPWYGQILKHHLSLNPDFEIHLFDTGKACLENLYKKPAIVSMDFNLPDMSGEQLFRRLRDENEQLPVIIVSGQDEISLAIDLLKRGAQDYIIKDEHTKELLWNSILKIKENACLKKQVEVLKQQLNCSYDLEKSMIGQSPALKKSFLLIEKAIKSMINVSITGETGTGKEVVAKAIHYNSERKKKPFVAVNMAAIPKELIESELFGYEQGAFTGANTRKAGKFEESHGGTLFLDEIAELDLSVQSKLLRVLQEREIVRLGSTQAIKFDARLIIATHKDLAEEVKLGNFREDLYYRIIGLPIALAPLRERGNDILLLAMHFVKHFAKENKSPEPTLSASAKEKLLKYNYPGNIRELKSIVDLACVMSDGIEIKEEDISFTGISSNKMISATEKTLKEYTTEIICLFLKKYNNNVIEAADRLDIGKSTIYNLLKSGDIKLQINESKTI